MQKQLTNAGAVLLLVIIVSACQFKCGTDAATRSSASNSARTEEKAEAKVKPAKNDDEQPESEIVNTKTEEELTAEETTSEDAPVATENELKSSARPEGDSKPVSQALGQKGGEASRGNWLYVYNSRKGYGFYVPPGTTGDWGRVRKVDTFAGATPNEVGIYVFAWKDRNATRETLLSDAGNILTAMGETVTNAEFVGAGGDYAVADATSVDAKGVRSRMKVLVGTDITDNYVMIVGCDENKFNAKKDTIDAIWGSFEMWSGGGSGR
ncbi:MAG: hypothetical protein M3209_01720 [Acidobacteriota bacterium]|nr:hypothetical protein [Acidobacteriota bacterium]